MKLLSAPRKLAELPDLKGIAAPPSKVSKTIVFSLVLLVLILVVLLALSLGRYQVPLNEAFRILAHEIINGSGLASVFEIRPTWTAQEATVVATVRLPRVILAVLAGGGLAISGAVLQAVFRNPLVSPDVVGVSSGASFGGVLAIILGGSGFWLIGSAFATGLLALGLVLLVGRVGAGSPVLMIVLGGIVVGAFFNALVSLLTYLADPYTKLPSITFWLMGSLSGATLTKVSIALIPVTVGVFVILLLRWRINIISLGDEDSLALGVNAARIRRILFLAVAAITATTVAVCGVVGWVGLVIPHLVRICQGPDHRTLLPLSFLVGGAYLVIVDTLSRTITQSEIPLGILTAIIGAPFFVFLLIRSRKKVLGDA